MMRIKQKEDLRPYRQFGLTLLQLMGGLAITGFLLTAVLNYLF
ncbi:MAG: hypothetical protein K0S27_422 [Gammaproteobacteria bacterium]|jgi:hypothetical protein|nr:hypothetical protein [Gammaproteobacteria bacterium]